MRTFNIQKKNKTIDFVYRTTAVPSCIPTTTKRHMTHGTYCAQGATTAGTVVTAFSISAHECGYFVCDPVPPIHIAVLGK